MSNSIVVIICFIEFGAGGEIRTRLFQFGRLTCNRKHFTRNLASPQGLEPRPAVLETDMLPLHQGDIILYQNNLR